MAAASLSSGTRRTTFPIGAAAAAVLAAAAAAAALHFVALRRRPASVSASVSPATLSVPVAIAKPLRLAYAHGGWMASALHLLRDARWTALLARLSPAHYRGATGPAATAASVMLLLENNAVLAAYGASHCDAGLPGAGVDGRPAVEWDVQLLASACAKVDAATIPSAAAAAGRELARTALIAHGTLKSFALAAFLGMSQYATLRASGASTAQHWLATFSEALSVATEAGEPGALRLLGRVGSALASGAAAVPTESFLPDLSKPGSSVPTVPALSLILDIKSGAASPACLLALVRALNDMGIFVWGVASFKHSQLCGLGDLVAAQCFTQRVRLLSLVEIAAAAAEESATAPTNAFAVLATPTLFYLTASLGDLQSAALARVPSIPFGAHVIFNAGSLLAAPKPSAPFAVDSSAMHAVRGLVASRRLQLGAYVGESSLDAASAGALVEHFNVNAELFPHSLSYSNLPGYAESAIPRGRGFGVPFPFSLALARPHRQVQST